MELPETFTELIRTAARFLADDAPLDPDAQLSALGIDSLEVVELIVQIEDMYGVEVPQDMLTPDVFACARTIWQALDKLLAERRECLPIDS